MNTFEEATRLAQLRQDARAHKNWQEADRLRDEITSLGYKVLDTPSGFTLEEETYSTVTTISDIKPDSIEFANQDTVVCLVIDGWLEDVVDSISRILHHTPFPIALIDLSDNAVVHQSLYELEKQHDSRLKVLIVQQTLSDVGWAASFNKLVEAVCAENVVIMDISTLLDGDAITPLLECLKENVVAAGWKGANVSPDWLSFEAATGSVDALLSYLFIVKRNVLREHPFDPKGKFYRNTDLEWSLEVKTAGYLLVAVDEDLPCTQARHHGYHDSDENYRLRESKRNYDRLLSKFRGKYEISPKPNS